MEQQNSSQQPKSGRATTWVIIIIVLLIGAYIIYDQANVSPTPDNENDQTTEQISEDEEVAATFGFPNNTSQEERDLLRPPRNSAPEAEQEEYAESLEEVAVDTNLFDFSDCEPNNPIIRAETGDMITLENQNEPVNINLNTENYTMESGETLTWEAGSETPTGEGYFSIVCSQGDETPVTMGLIWVQQPEGETSSE